MIPALPSEMTVGAIDSLKAIVDTYKTYQKYFEEKGDKKEVENYQKRIDEYEMAIFVLENTTH